MPEQISVQPNELRFRFELKKQLSCSLRLTNISSDLVAFKVKTTAPKKYCVRPNAGIIQPRSSCDVTVTMQAQREVPLDLQCKDKFLIQSAKAPKGATISDIQPEIFNKEENKDASETKLKVVYLQAEGEGSTYEAKGAIASTDAAGKQSQRLQQDLRAMRGKVDSKSPPSKGSTSGSTFRSRAGFSFILVFLIGLVGIVVGYMISQS